MSFIGGFTVQSNILAGITVTDMRYEKSSQTVICTTTGGPVTTITWTKNGIPLPLDGSTYQSSQVILDTVSSRYENRLSFSGPKSDSLSGTYACQVANLRGTTSSQLAVTGI